MNQPPNKFDEYINSHPRESLWIAVFVTLMIWQSAPTMIGLVLYVVLINKMQCKSWQILILGVTLMLMTVYLSQHGLQVKHWSDYIQHGFRVNKIFWLLIFKDKLFAACMFLYRYDTSYIVGSPLLIASIFGFIDLIPNNPHESKIKALQKGVYRNEIAEINDKKIQKKLDKIVDQQADGTLLGLSKYYGKPIIIPDKHLNQVALVLGTTGSGKTITLRRFYYRAIVQGYPLIVIDGKPDEANIAWLTDLAQQYGRQFYGFNCGNRLHYDPLANGGFTELKDKIICLKDEWENDYYRSIAEDYLQTTFAILLKLKVALDLKLVVDCLNYTKLKLLSIQTNDSELIERVKHLKKYDSQDITGLQAHLNILINSELGHYFLKNDDAFSLTDVLQSKGVVYFALPALRFPSFAKVLGKLVINDIKAVIDRPRKNPTPIFTVFDEFSVFAGDQVMNLVNMGRGKGVHAIFGTQGLADLDKVDPTFKSQVLNCVNTLICHRLNDQDSAEAIANWVGTHDVFNVTAQLNMKEVHGSGMGSVKVKKEYIVHPDAIKQELGVGEAFYVSKVGAFRRDKVVVKYV